ncbi:TonB-dependent receptor [Acinetobacter higginsii]|uniref:TonB-dependent receptor n=1 Tax=Acinetobacter higginsii TaxID=70347 RepID=UPI001F4B67DA|nr:TonB-dependent receptor [Acinetobacter higginsii]MCH7341692.1 TonB-dependent receptor [Acinetobacter higginsii]
MKFKKQTLAILIHCFCISGAHAEITSSVRILDKPAVERTYQIAENPLGYVLSSFAAQSGIVLSYDSEQLKGLKSKGISGKYSVQHGFDYLLADQPYQVIKQGQTYLLVPKNSSMLGHAEKLTSHANTHSRLEQDAKAIVVMPEIKVNAEPQKQKVNTTHLDREQISRFRGTGNGDVFSDIAGVQVNSLRNEAGAIDIGIRGMQGEGRVPVIIDGSLQSSHTFRGYQGESDRTYIDMDLISQIEVEKGASRAKSSVGGIGGIVKMRTLSANDILLPNQNAGVMLKGSFYNNNRTPQTSDNEKEQMSYLLHNKISSHNFQNGAGTLALAYRNDMFDLVAAYSKREVGNYYAGKHGIEYYEKRDIVDVGLGQEVVNTSYQSDSGIIKAGMNITDEHRVEVNLRRHVQKAGEVMAFYWNRSKVIDPNSPPYGYIDDEYVEPKYIEGAYTMPQWSLGSAAVNAFSTSYTYKPKHNPLVDLELGVWHTNAKYRQHNGMIGMKNSSYGDQYWGSFQDYRSGLNLENTSKFDQVTLNYGLTYDEQRMKPRHLVDHEIARDGLRKESSVFLNGDYVFNDFSLSLGSKWHKAKVEDYGDQYRPMTPVAHSDLNNKGYAVRDFGGNIDWMSQLNYKLWDGIDLYGKLSNTHRSPSLFESTVSGQTFSYDPDLPVKPENSRLIELGFIGERDNVFAQDDHLKFNLNYFRNQTKDFLTQGVQRKDIPNPITPDFILPYTSSYTFVNYNQVVMKGLEFDLSYNHPSFFASLNGTLYQAPKVCPANKSECNEVGDSWSLISTRLPPRKILNITVGKNLFENKLVVGARAKYHSEKTNPKGWLAGTGVSGRAVTEISSETLIDLFASYKWSPNVALSFNVDNLTNRYNFDPGTVIGMPIPGRTIKAGIEMKF